MKIEGSKKDKEKEKSIGPKSYIGVFLNIGNKLAKKKKIKM